MEELRTSAAHVFVDSLDDLLLDPDDTHHLARVLRVRQGEVVTASDGAGAWRRCRWTGEGLSPDGAVRREPARERPLTIGIALVKGERPEWVVQKTTELGIDRIVILKADRSVARWDSSKEQHQLQRLRRVAREASMQARRCHVPRVDGLMTPAQLGGAMAHWGGVEISDVHVTVMIGPEGGWSDAELGLGLPRVALGPTVLRSETAAIAAAVLMTRR